MLVLKYVSICFSLSVQMILPQPYPEAWTPYTAVRKRNTTYVQALVRESWLEANLGNKFIKCQCFTSVPLKAGRKTCI